MSLVKIWKSTDKLHHFSYSTVYIKIAIQATDPMESQTVTVKGTRALRKDKKPVKATWY